jgi:hypothetical protein
MCLHCELRYHLARANDIARRMVEQDEARKR